MNPVAQSSAPAPRLRLNAMPSGSCKRARQFEGVLLNSLLGSLEHSFSALPGKKPDSIADNYHSMGMQALSATLAARGGVGIASMIIRNLMRTKGQNHITPAGAAKVP